MNISKTTQSEALAIGWFFVTTQSHDSLGSFACYVFGIFAVITSIAHSIKGQ